MLLSTNMMRIPVLLKLLHTGCFFCLLFFSIGAKGQDTPVSKKAMSEFKNVVRYNLSSAILFGVDKCVVLGYERVIRPNQSISVNFGKISLPKLISINTDSFNLNKDVKNSGYNVSIDYRFYLPKENKHLAPHGLYIGPYYSYSRFTRENRWEYTSSANSYVTTNSEFNINRSSVSLFQITN